MVAGQQQPQRMIACESSNESSVQACAEAEEDRRHGADATVIAWATTNQIGRSAFRCDLVNYRDELRWGAAERAGERRSDVGSDHLLGWFVGQFRGGRRADAGRRIY